MHPALVNPFMVFFEDPEHEAMLRRLANLVRVNEETCAKSDFEHLADEEGTFMERAA